MGHYGPAPGAPGPTDRRDPQTLDSSDSFSYAGSEAYRLALDYLYGRIDYEKIGHAPYNKKNYRLDRMRRLLEILGNPQESYAILHVAGTKGKGTVSVLLSECLRANGVSTGLYTSPHLVRLEERFQVDGRMASPQELVDLTAVIQSACNQLQRDGFGPATFFEMTTAMGMLHFAQEKVQCAVLEVGLGGRLDSTNVCHPIVSIITSISEDHQKQLGNTIPEIASEKAGIIKPNTPVVAVARNPLARQVIAERAQEQNADLHLIGREFDVSWKPCAITTDRDLPELASTTVAMVQFTQNDSNAKRASEVRPLEPSMETASAEPVRIQPARIQPVQLLGRHQADNIGAVLRTCDVLNELGWELSREAIHDQLANCTAKARLQIVGTRPIQILDTAHNPASISAGIDALQQHFPQLGLNVVFAASSDKDVEGMLKLLLQRSERIVVTNYCNNPRSIRKDDLVLAARSVARTQHSSCEILAAESPKLAWQTALRLNSESQLTYATGSLFLAAELLESVPELM